MSESDGPSKAKQIAGAGVEGTESLPPRFSVTFTQDEFVGFIADPAAGLEALGYKVDHITVSLRDKVWVPKDQKWAGREAKLHLPESQSWGWLCGYEDEMCVCYPVLM